MMVPLDVPVRYTHSTVECIHLGDLDNLVRPLESVVLKLDKRGDRGLADG
jgi:putative aminopeptidase FrvX